MPTNLSTFKKRYPRLAAEMLANQETGNIRTVKDQAGNITYAKDIDGHLCPIYDSSVSAQQIQTQMQNNTSHLNNFARPVLLVGLYPGDELIFLYNRSRKAAEEGMPQHIYVCVDSFANLQGFLNTFDVSEIIESSRVHFFWHENAEQQARDLLNHPERSPVVTLISGSSNGTARRVIAPFNKIGQHMAAETKRLIAENNTYYDSITDNQLATIISRNSPLPPPTSRPPRLMLVTSASSTVTQYSARDTTAAFKNDGWQTKHLNTEESVSPYYIALEINKFKPDIFLFINHLRTETLSIYPRNMMFITWIQDTLPHINNKTAATQWNSMAQSNLSHLPGCTRDNNNHRPGTKDKELKSPGATSSRRRDLIIGYVGQIRKYGYLKERLAEMPMIVNPDIFRPRKLTEEQNKKYSCDIMYASNRSKPTSQAIKEDILPVLSAYGFTGEMLMSLHDHLWTQYRSGRTYTTYDELETELLRHNPPMTHQELRTKHQGLKTTCETGSGLDFTRAEGAKSKRPNPKRAFQQIYNSLPSDAQDQAIQTLFWRLNDSIYRHVVLEWIDEIISSHPVNPAGQKPGADDQGLRTKDQGPRTIFHLYGRGWENHPRFSKYAKGNLKHGSDLSRAYQAARFSLHLNTAEGTHQRLQEIIASGGTVLSRWTRKSMKNEPSSDFMGKLTNSVLFGPQRLSDFERDTTLSDSDKNAFKDLLFLTALEIADSLKQRKLKGEPCSSRPDFCQSLVEKLRVKALSRPDWITNQGKTNFFKNREDLKETLH